MHKKSSGDFDCMNMARNNMDGRDLKREEDAMRQEMSDKQGDNARTHLAYSYEL